MSKIHILVIEDDRQIRENTAELLELEGYAVTMAGDGKKGLEKIKQSSPDLILCDLLMPEMDGLSLLAALGRHPNLKNIPFIFFSAKSEKMDIKLGMNSGADDYLVKPFELEDLLASIKKCLDKNRCPKK